jgi:pimeloyl-ACP methyl ester carboxylesterase
VDALLLHRAWLTVVSVGVAAVVGAALYLVVSYAVMLRHTDARPVFRTLRAMFGESLAIALTQPLLPLFYLFGRRMGGPATGHPVIFVHGYFQNRVDFLYLARALRRAGLGPLYGFNYDWTGTIAGAAARLGVFVDRACRETNSDAVDIVAHSLGGVVALEYIATPLGMKRVKRCVTIASPHAGVAWRGGMIGSSARALSSRSDFMKTYAARVFEGTGPKILSIYSTHDNIVHPWATSALSARGGTDLAVDDVGHLGILFSRTVADAVVRALKPS